MSQDGMDYQLAGKVFNEMREPVISYILFGVPVEASGRFVRFKAARSREWLFLDEIVVK